jgi:hypothetical integral membrane protein (TIGR02206 family)
VGTSFVLFSWPHWIGLLGAVITAIVLIQFRVLLRESKQNRLVRYGITAVLIGSEAALYSWYTLHDAWGWYALPFQLCTLTLWFSVYALLTRSYKVYEIAFFLGILGAIQALLTPYLTVTVPDFRYFHFFIAHIAIIAAGVFLTAVEGYRPTIRSVLRSWLWLHVLAIPAVITNALTGNNFMFLARKPHTESLLDLMAPWPWYIVQLELVVLVLCFTLLGVVFVIDRLTKPRQRSRS